jgi:PAS domain S-box-containing protein
MNRDPLDSSPRPTGLAAIPELPWGTHLCIFYDSAEDLLGLLPAYFTAGLEQGERCFVLASPQLGMDRIVAALRRGIADFDARVASGALVLLEGEQMYGPGGQFDRARTITTWRRLIVEAIAAGYSGLRGFGDESWLGSRDWESFSAYEADLEIALHEEPSLILCAYPIDHRSAHEVFSVARTHDVVLARLQGRWQVLESARDDESRLVVQARRARLQRELLQVEHDLDSANEKLADSASQRARLEQALKALQQRFDAVLSTTQLGVVVKRLRDDRIIEANEAFLRKLGYRREEVIGRTAVELAMWGEPTHREVQARMLGAEGRLDGFEITARTRDGKAVDLVLHSQPLDVEGEACMLITLYDQTASRRTERQLVEQQWLFGETERLARTGSWQWGGGTFTWSAELYRLHGVSPEKFAPSFESWLALVHSADRNRFRDAIENAIRNMGSFEVEHRVLLADGAVRVLRSVGYCARHGGDDGYRVVGYSTDITQLSETMAELRATLRKLVDLQEASQRGLAAEIHDRIGQLLTAISMNLETMRPRVTVDSALQHRLDDSIRLVQDATDSVVNILGELRPSGLEELDLVAALQRYCVAFAKRSGIEATLDADIGSTPIPAEWATPIFRIVQEGLTNVAKHASACHATVRLSGNDRELEVVIEDDGLGIGRAGTRDGSSSGLGLVTTRERVAALGGSFQVGARSGGGTRLVIRFPLEQPAASGSGRLPVSGIY